MQHSSNSTPTLLNMHIRSAPCNTNMNWSLISLSIVCQPVADHCECDGRFNVLAPVYPITLIPQGLHSTSERSIFDLSCYKRIQHRMMSLLDCWIDWWMDSWIDGTRYDTERRSRTGARLGDVRYGREKKTTRKERKEREMKKRERGWICVDSC